MDEELITPRSVTAAEAEEIQRAFTVKVYGWMTAGLAITAIFALLTLSSEEMFNLVFSSRWTFLGLIFAELGLVIWLSARIQHMSALTATLVFGGYSALTGVTMASIFVIYTASSAASTFAVCAGMFAATAAYGYLTTRDLTGLGGFMTMGLIGLILGSVVNLFFANATVYWITTYIGVLIFVGLSAYDAQAIKALSAAALQGSETEQKAAIFGALKLYLDFVNLFLFLLRLLGRRR
ncbi:MAG TPA: Bax inhibitor-1/YccA family protein [Bacteroidota bacterium]|nr:Bax inhibitor-1/YccA family protein [Bacteroidota bacterium]